MIDLGDHDLRQNPCREFTREEILRQGAEGLNFEFKFWVLNLLNSFTHVLANYRLAIPVIHTKPVALWTCYVIG